MEKECRGCGKRFQTNRKIQKFCSIACKLVSYKGRYKVESSSPLRWHDCRCPKCGRVHRLYIYWSGNGNPRKYCQGCKVQLFSANGEDYSMLEGI